MVAVRVEVTGGGDKPFVATYAGEQETVRHLVPFLTSALCATRPGASASVTEVLRSNSWDGPIEELTGDLAVLAGPGHLDHPERNLALRLPLRVHQVADTSAPWPDVERRITRRERTAIRRSVEACDYVVEVEHRAELAHYFYDEIYRPTMTARHGTSARMVSREDAFRLFTDGGVLLLLHSGEKVVAGALCHRSADGVLHGRLIGLLGGDDEWRRRGAMSVLYQAVLRWAHDNGVARVDLSGGEPFLSKGTFQFKRKFGADVVLPATWLGSRTVSLVAARDSPMMRGFLIANPPIVHDGSGSLSARYFFDRNTEPRLDLSDNCGGLSGRQLCNLDEFPWD